MNKHISFSSDTPDVGSPRASQGGTPQLRAVMIGLCIAPWIAFFALWAVLLGNELDHDA